MTTHRGLSSGTDEALANHTGGLYEIKIQGHLDDHWVDWFEGLAFRHVVHPRTGLELTVLRGAFPDQPALHGILTRIRDLNLVLISVTRLDRASGRNRYRRRT